MGNLEDWKNIIPSTSKSSNEQSTDKQDSKIEKQAQSVDIGATSSIGAGGIPFGAGMAQSVFTRPLDYRPEFASPDRWLLPKDLGTQIKYWRMFYELDPLIGSVIDVYSEMMWSEFTILNVDGEIKRNLELMLNDLLHLQNLMKNVAVEFLVSGEAIVHLFYDKSYGLWSGYVFHKPEDVSVIDLNLVSLEPILILNLNEEDLKNLRKLKKLYDAFDKVYEGEQQKKESLSQMFWLESDYIEEALRSKKVILEPLNVGYIPRKLHPYNERGVSLLTRLWRVLMFEDALFSASIATAKRHASPVKVVSMGDLASGYIPTEQQIKGLLSALAQAETDVHAWVSVPPGTRFEAWGTTDRLMGISKEYEIIERLKLTALGVSKDFITGASTFASAQASLQVFLSRLLSFRNMLEETFIYPKLLKTIVKVNRWRMPTQAEVEHKIIKSPESEKDFVRPRIRWAKSLKPVVDRELLDAYKDIVRDFEIKLSKDTVMNVVGLDWSQELRKKIMEEQAEKLFETESKQDFGVGGFPSAPSVPPEIGGLEEIAPPPEAETGGGEAITMHAGSVKEDNFLKGVHKYSGSLIDKINDSNIIRDRITKMVLNTKKK